MYVVVWNTSPLEVLLSYAFVSPQSKPETPSSPALSSTVAFNKTEVLVISEAETFFTTGSVAAKENLNGVKIKINAKTVRSENIFFIIIVVVELRAKVDFGLYLLNHLMIIYLKGHYLSSH